MKVKTNQVIREEIERRVLEEQLDETDMTDDSFRELLDETEVLEVLDEEDIESFEDYVNLAVYRIYNARG